MRRPAVWAGMEAGFSMKQACGGPRGAVNPGNSSHEAAETPGILLKGKPVTETWLAQQVRPYGVKPGTTRIGAPPRAATQSALRCCVTFWSTRSPSLEQPAGPGAAISHGHRL